MTVCCVIFISLIIIKLGFAVYEYRQLLNDKDIFED